jgi:hypothetical protein
LICSAWVSITSQDASMMSAFVEACVMFIGFDLMAGAASRANRIHCRWWAPRMLLHFFTFACGS